MLRIFESLEATATKLVTALEGVEFEKDLKLAASVLERLPGLIDAVTVSLKAMGVAASVAIGPLAAIGGAAVVTNQKDRARIDDTITGMMAGQTRKEIEEGGFANRLRAAGRGALFPFKAIGIGVRNMFSDTGSDVARGLSDGMAAGTADVRASGMSLGNAAKDGADTSLERHSPSRVFMEIGRDTAAGFSLGIRDSADAVDASVRGLLTIKVPPARAGALGGGSGGVPQISLSTAVTVHATSTADPRAIGDAVAERVAKVSAQAVLTALEEVATSAGVA
jgi:hypothetical protein